MKLALTILLVCWTILMGLLLFSPGSTYGGAMFFKGEDKVAHFGLFFGWAFLMAMRGYFTRLSPWRLHLTIVLVAVAGGILSEILQGYIPNRSQDVYDFVADVVGILFGMSCAILAKRWIKIPA